MKIVVRIYCVFYFSCWMGKMILDFWGKFVIKGDYEKCGCCSYGGRLLCVEVW